MRHQTALPRLVRESFAPAERRALREIIERDDLTMVKGQANGLAAKERKLRKCQAGEI